MGGRRDGERDRAKIFRHNPIAWSKAHLNDKTSDPVFWTTDYMKRFGYFKP